MNNNDKCWMCGFPLAAHDLENICATCLKALKYREKNKEKIEIIKQKILNFKSYEQIGNELKISRQRVHQILSEAKISTSEIIKQRENDLVNQIKSLAQQGYAIGEIADLLGFSYSQIQARCQKFSIEVEAQKSYAKNLVHCNNKATEKAGLTPLGYQLWICPDCKRKFVSR